MYWFYSVIGRIVNNAGRNICSKSLAAVITKLQDYYGWITPDEALTIFIHLKKRLVLDKEKNVEFHEILVPTVIVAKKMACDPRFPNFWLDPHQQNYLKELNNNLDSLMEKLKELLNDGVDVDDDISAGLKNDIVDILKAKQKLMPDNRNAWERQHLSALGYELMITQAQIEEIFKYFEQDAAKQFLYAYTCYLLSEDDPSPVEFLQAILQVVEGIMPNCEKKIIKAREYLMSFLNSDVKYSEDQAKNIVKVFTNILNHINWMNSGVSLLQLLCEYEKISMSMFEDNIFELIQHKIIKKPSIKDYIDNLLLKNKASLKRKSEQVTLNDITNTHRDDGERVVKTHRIN